MKLVHSVSWNNAFRVFQSRNYSLFFAGQFISRIGTWMQRTAVIWVIYTMTHSVVWVGLTTFAEQFPSFILSPLGGIVADRYDRYKVLMCTQLTAAVQAIALTLLYSFGTHGWAILLLSGLLGVANAFDMPARQAMVNDIINNEEELPSAIAMNSSLNNLTRLAGPALAGIILAAYSATACFATNAVSFVAVIICLNLMRFPARKSLKNIHNAWTDFREGLRYTRSQQEISKTLLLLALVCFLVATYNTLQPYFAKDIFDGDSATYGYINSATGLGALVSTLYLAVQKDSSQLKRILFFNLLILGAGLILMAYTRVFSLFLLLSFICGFGTMSVLPVCNTIVQMVSTSQMRGRVVGFFAMAAFGTLPLGAVLVGWIAKLVHPQNCVSGQGAICLIIAAVFYRFLHTKTEVRSIAI